MKLKIVVLVKEKYARKKNDAVVLLFVIRKVPLSSHV